MKVLLVNWVYNWGSTGYIIRDLRNELTKLGHEVLVSTGRNYDGSDVMVFSKSLEQSLFWKMHRLGLSTFRGSTLATKRLIRYIRQTKPDIVNLHLLHCNFLNLYYLLEWLGKNNIKTVVTNHAELYFTGSCGYSYECTKFITNECRHCNNRKYASGNPYIGGYPHLQWKQMHRSFSFFKKNNILFTAVSPWTQKRFYLSPITKGYKCNVTLNGLNTNIFKVYEDNCGIFNRLGNNKPFVLWVTSNFNPYDKTDVKGGYYMLELARFMPNHRFVIVSTDSVEIENLPDNIYLWGRAQNQEELAQLYNCAEITVLLSRKETFSMVTAESLCCGTPVVGFKAGGPEAIAIPKYSKFVDQSDIKSLSKAIGDMRMTLFDRKEISNAAKEFYSSKAMAIQYLKTYKELLDM